MCTVRGTRAGAKRSSSASNPGRNPGRGTCLLCALEVTFRSHEDKDMSVSLLVESNKNDTQAAMRLLFARNPSAASKRQRPVHGGAHGVSLRAIRQTLAGLNR